MKHLNLFVLMLILALGSLSSCDSCTPEKKNNWSEAEKYAVGASTTLNCGDSLQIHLSAGDSIFVHPEGVVYAGMCHVEMAFFHKMNGAWQRDEYRMETDKWKILNDSTNVKILCVPQRDDNCQFRLKTKKK